MLCRNTNAVGCHRPPALWRVRIKIVSMGA